MFPETGSWKNWKDVAALLPLCGSVTGTAAIPRPAHEVKPWTPPNSTSVSSTAWLTHESVSSSGVMSGNARESHESAETGTVAEIRRAKVTLAIVEVTFIRCTFHSASEASRWGLRRQTC